MKSVEELTVQFEKDGVVLVEELGKVVLSSGNWATILFRFREFDEKEGVFLEEKFALRRYQKRRGGYAVHSRFTISNVTQAKQVQKALSEWTQDA